MNYVDKFDSGSLGGQGWFAGAGESFSVDVHAKGNASGHGGPDIIVVPDAHLLFSGDYRRSGLDLVLSKDGNEFVVRDYFRGENRAALASPDGANLSGATVEALTGQVDYAQAGGNLAPETVIGHVTKLTGSATAIRNGVSITLNVGDNVHKGDVVQSGSDSALGITFIDGTVFGLSSNARMVLNEMIYDPAGSNNASLLTLVQGTISFVAGATAKHGDMKVETPTATMGIRGTAVLVEIDFDLPQLGGAPPVSFRILVEPNGETGEYVLLDKLTRQPIATVNQPGTQTIVNGQGVVTFVQSAEIPANAQRLINEIFALKFTDANPKFIGIPPLDTITPQSFLARLPDGTPIDQIPVIYIALVFEPLAPPPPSGGNTRFHLNIPPDLIASGNHFTERLLTTGNSALDAVSGIIHFDDINPEDRPTVTADFNSFVYRDEQQDVIITSSLTLEQLAAIQAVQVPLSVVQHADNTNVGDATWTYRVPDHALDFLAEGETLTLIYMARVDTNYSEYNTVVFTPFKITITGSNDLPTVAATGSGIIELDGTGNPDIDHAEGVITFADVDLTDRPTVTAPFANYVYTDANGFPLTLTPAQEAALAAALTLTPAQGNTNNGSVAWSYDVADSNFDFIAAGETLVLTYNATVDDGHGGIVIVPLTLTVTVDGTNDLPTVTVSSDGFIELVGTTNSSTTNHAGGTISFTDVDLTDQPTVTTHFTSFTYQDALHNDFTSPLTAQQEAAIAAVEALLTLTPDGGNANSGSVTWSYDLADSSFDFLADGETLALTYTATVDDGHGGIVSTPFTVTITGSNDVPVAVGDANTIDDVVESGVNQANTPFAGDPTAVGNVLANDVDVDINHVLNVAAVAGLAGNVGTAVTGTYGSIVIAANGSYTYTLNNADPDTQALAQGGAPGADVFSYTVTDEFGATSTANLTITITGSNDAPVIDAGGELVVANFNSATISNFGSNAEDAPTVYPLISLGNPAVSPFSVAYADVTGDGIDDVITANRDSNNISVLKGNAQGGFDAAVSFASGGTAPRGIATGDFNNDGRNDIAVTNGSGTVAILVNDGSGGFAVGPSGSVSYDLSYTIGTGDFNGDSNLDLAVANFTTGYVSVILGDGNGGLSVSGSYPVNGVGANTLGPRGLAVGDVNNDGALDIVSVNQNSTDVSVFLGDGNGGFAPAANYSSNGGTGSLSVTLGDLNSDGLLDIVTADFGSNSISVLTNLGSGQFASGVTHQTTSSAVGVVVADVNGDGFTDVVTTQSNSNSIAVFSGDGTGALASAVTFSTGGTVPLALAVSASSAIGSVREDSVTSASGQLTASDVDQGATQTWSIVGSAAGAYGSIAVDGTGQWTYTLANSTNVVQALAAGEYHEEQFTVRVTDDQGAFADQLVAVKVTGTNDIPVIAGVATGDVAEDMAVDNTNHIVTTGQLTIIDADAGQSTFAAQASTSATYGVFSLAEDGTWTYTADNTQSAIQQLGANGTLTDSFTAVSSDGTASQLVTVTITGTNDAPVISTANLQISETNATTISGLSMSDVDASDTFTITATATSGSTVTLVPPGLSSGTLADVNATLAAGFVYAPGAQPPQTDMVSLTVEDASGATDTVNFIFNFGNQSDELIGTAHEDVFVFTANSNHDEITDFTAGTDHIDLTALSSIVDSSNIDDFLTDNVTSLDNNNTDTLITLSSNDTIILRNVASLQASDFIVHAA